MGAYTYDIRGKRSPPDGIPRKVLPRHQLQSIEILPTSLSIDYVLQNIHYIAWRALCLSIAFEMEELHPEVLACLERLASSPQEVHGETSQDHYGSIFDIALHPYDR